jgi:hypothetical protein
MEHRAMQFEKNKIMPLLGDLPLKKDLMFDMKRQEKN